MTRCLLGLGSNLGHRGTTLRRATSEVARLSGCQLLARSRWHETLPIGGPGGQRPFLNAALLIETAAGPAELAQALWAIEARLGRNRGIRWDARSIDIDLLLYGRRVIQSPPELLVPHPRMSFRTFVLQPATEIAGSMMHPLSGWTIGQLCTHLATSPRYVAVCAAEPAASSWLAAELARLLGCPILEDLCANNKKMGDSTPQTAVEFGRWASVVLQRAFWERNEQLSNRLASSERNPLLSASPVVSAFWYPAGPVPTGAESTSRSLGVTLGGNVSRSVCLEDVIEPALVVAWDPPSSQVLRSKIHGKKMLSHAAIPAIKRSNLRHLLDRTGHGPVARIQKDDPAVVVHEAVAAVQSVWPDVPQVCSE